jgi:hypothetical protein
MAGQMLDPALLAGLWRVSPASLAAYVSRLDKTPWVAARHLKLLSHKLVDMVMGRCLRLIITMPPRHGKSEMVSHWTPIWLLENFPEKRIILTSYEADFAASWGRKVRDTILRHQDDLNLRLDMNVQASNSWMTLAGGGMNTAGVGGPITGKGADLLIVDDAVKNWQEASSYTIRERTWEWWQSTARTRLEPGAGVVVMFTRWHEEDLVGKLIDQMKIGGEHWEVFNFPAVALEHDALGRKPGEPLWPERYPLTELNILKSSMSVKVWNALYQQTPSGDDERGNVYHTFSYENVKPTIYDPRLPLVWAMDFNVDPMTSVIGQYQKGFRQDLDVAWVIEEIVLQDSNTYKMCEEFAKRAFMLTGGHQVVVEIYGDASGRQRRSSAEKTDWEIVKACLARYHFITPQYRYKSKNPSVKDRINATVGMLQSADGLRRLTIDPKCEELIADYRRMSWDRDTDGNPTGQMDKSDPKRSHVSDACGYWLESQFKLRPSSGEKQGIMQ